MAGLAAPAFPAPLTPLAITAGERSVGFRVGGCTGHSGLPPSTHAGQPWGASGRRERRGHVVPGGGRRPYPGGVERDTSETVFRPCLPTRQRSSLAVLGPLWAS